MYICMYVHAYVRMYVSIYVCMYVCTNIIIIAGIFLVGITTNCLATKVN